ncbi:MAG: hypothetical protein ACRCSL_04500 [Microbacterium sp.]
MDIAISQSLPRIVRLALLGAATAFAWIVFTLLLGLGTGQAHADDGDEGLLGAVTSVVDETASSVTGTVSSVTSGATKVVNTVVAVAVAPAPVQGPVREVVAAVGDVVTTTTAPVTDVVSGGVVEDVAGPVADVVTQVPLVGDVAEAIGLDDAVEDLAGTVDDTLGELTGAVTDTGTGIGLPPIGAGPGLPGLPGSPITSLPVEGHLLPALDVVLPAAARVYGAAVAGAAASALSAFLTAYEHPATVSVAAAPAADTRAPLSPAGGLCPPSSSSSGPGGAGSGAWAVVALGPLVALRAWVRRAGPEDERAPAAPAGLTDVSPD